MSLSYLFCLALDESFKFRLACVPSAGGSGVLLNEQLKKQSASNTVFLYFARILICISH